MVEAVIREGKGAVAPTVMSAVLRGGDMVGFLLRGRWGVGCVRICVGSGGSECILGLAGGVVFVELAGLPIYLPANSRLTVLPILYLLYQLLRYVRTIYLHLYLFNVAIELTQADTSGNTDT